MTSRRISGILTILLSALFVSFLLLADHSAARSQGPTPTFQAFARVSSAAGSANVRSEPSQDSEIIGNLPNDTHVQILDLNATDDWYRVRIPDGTEGWIFGPLLTILPTPTPERASPTPLPPTSTPIDTFRTATPTPTATVIAKNALSYVARAELFIDQRAFGPALADLDAALRLNPNLEEAYLSRALIHLWQDDEAAAVEDLEKASDSARTYRVVALLYLRHGYDRLALAYTEIALSMGPDDALSHYVRGEILAYQADYRGAVAEYALAIEQDPLNVEYHLAQGTALVHAGQMDEARTVLDASTWLAPHDVMIHVRIGNDLILMNEPLLSMGHFQWALDLDRDSFAAYLGQGDALAAMGLYEEALVTYEHARVLNPDSALPSLRIGRLYLDPNVPVDEERNRYSTALRYLDEAVSLDPQSGVALFWRGVAHGKLGNIGAFDDAFFQACYLDPKETLIYSDAFFAEDSTSDDALFHRALSYSNLGRFEESIADWTELIRRNPDDYLGYANRGATYGLQNAPEAAIADLDIAIELGGGTSAALWSNRGAQYYAIGRELQALTDLNKALSIDPDLAAAYLWRARVLVRLGNVDAAFADFDHAIELDPMLADAYHQRALLLADRGQHDMAVEDYTTAITLDPQNADYYYDRALSLHELYNNVQACLDIRLAAALGNGSTVRKPTAWEIGCSN